MMLFTAAMIGDIFMFGLKMQKTYLADAFGRSGKFVLVLLGVLLMWGWFLVGRPYTLVI